MKTATFTFKKVGPTLKLDNKELFDEWCKHIKNDEVGQMVISNIPKQKSTQQNKTYWFIVDRACQDMEDLGIDTSYLYGDTVPTGLPITKDCFHQFLYALCPHFDDAGNALTMSSAKWDSKMESEMIETALNWLAAKLGIVINLDDSWRIQAQ